MFNRIKERLKNSGPGHMVIIGWILCVCWMVFIAGFSIWEIKTRQRSIIDLATIEAQINYNKDLAYRRWAAGHGGVYVPVTSVTRPNPYLKQIAERDITTPSGKRLTLINPAYMTRQVHELALDQYGVRGHITSLNPLRPENSPDPWEEEALKKFTVPSDQMIGISTINNKEHLRFMQAMETEETCLKCHAHQGYKTGDIRGGISVAVPLDRYRAIAHDSIETTLLVNSFLLLLGIVTLWLIFFNLSRRDRQRLEVEQALKESEAFHRGLFEDSPVVLFLQDFSEAEIEVNRLRQRGVTDLRSFLEKNPNEVKRIASLVRMTKANMAAVDLYKAIDHANLFSLFSMIMEKKQWQKFIDLMVVLIGGQDQYECQDSQHDAKGNPIEVIIKKVVINREANGLSKILVTIIDVTDLYRSHEEKTELERQLQQAQRIESLGSLAGGIAHDFNNILFPIVGMAEMLMEDLPPDTPEHENASIILDAGNRGSELVRQILAFSSQDDGKLILLPIHKAVNEVLRLISSTIPAEVEINRDIDETCGPILADPIRIQQIVMNILTNAIHAVEGGGNKKTIKIEVKEVNIEDQGLTDTPPPPLAPGRYARLTVSDNGVGISPAHLNRIFEPYFTTRSHGKGTGLGLAMVYKIVKGYRGDIFVKSEPDKGTIFTVYLPVNGNGSEQTPVIEKLSHGTDNETILLVDDEAPIMRLEKQMLERLGYRVIEHTDSEEALSIFRQNPHAFDLVISDMLMPRLSGDRLVQEILSIRPDMPIVICTGFSNLMNKTLAEQMGIKGFLMKPVLGKDLAHMVRKVLNGTT